MRNIIAPVNFSPNSNNAARYAADLALATQAKLHLLYVLQLPVSIAEFPVTDYAFNAMQEAGAESLKNLWEELVKRTEARIDILFHMEIGTVEHSIETFCEGKAPFAVVMGASGNTLERAIVGGNVVAAIRHLPYPLIVVPENVSFRAIKKVLLACDLEDVSAGLPVKPYLQVLKQVFDAGFEVININTSDQQLTAGKIMQIEAWKQCVREIIPEVNFVSNENVEDGIGAYLADHPADILLVFPKKHNFFEFHKSHSKKIAFNSKVPVMSIHA
jgi:nucleotide-binding universal stress UspA family protein